MFEKFKGLNPDFLQSQPLQNYQNYAHVGQANTINKGTNTIQANY
jgi:hypothetical protein